MKIKVRRTTSTTTEVEVEVQFPFYRHRDWSTDDSQSDYYIRVYLDGTTPMQTVIRKSVDYRDQDYPTWEIDIERFNPNGDGDDVLGKGRFALTEAKWLAVVAEFRAFIDNAANPKVEDARTLEQRLRDGGAIP